MLSRNSNVFIFYSKKSLLKKSLGPRCIIFHMLIKLKLRLHRTKLVEFVISQDYTCGSIILYVIYRVLKTKLPILI
jgi:hypothetical protein